MNRRFPCTLMVLTAAVIVLLRPAAGAGAVLLESVAPGPYTDPLLAAGAAIVRQQGFRGDFAALVALSGLADETAACRLDCGCRETMHSAAQLGRLVSPLKGSVTRHGWTSATAEQGWAALTAELSAGRPVLAEQLSGPNRLDLVVGFQSEGRVVLVAGRQGRSRHSFDEWARGRWTFATARLGTTKLPGGKAEMDAIAGILTRSRQPRIEDGCVARDERVQNAVGLEGYRLFAEEAKRGESVDPAVVGLRLASWTERRQMLARFLKTAADRRQGAAAEHLREAAEVLQREVDQGLKPLAATCPYPPPPGAEKRQSDPAVRGKQAVLAEKASDMRQGFLKKIEPVAFQHLGLSKEQRRLASIDARHGTANPGAVRGMLASPNGTVRTLGALAAARTGDASLAPELAEKLNSGDAVEARTALDALKTINPPNLVGMLEQQAAAMEAAGKAIDGDGADGIGPQLQTALRDLRPLPTGMDPAGHDRHPLPGLLGGPTLFVILGVAIIGLALVAWRVAGPVRLAAAVEEPPAAIPVGVPAEAARLETLLAKPPATGLMLTHLDLKGQAFRQGLRVGDVLMKYAGHPVQTLDDLRRLTPMPGTHQREIVARRDLRAVKTVVGCGPLGLDGVSVTKGTPFWRRQPSAPFTPDYSGLAGEGEAWYRITKNGRAIGLERRGWRWVKNELEMASVAAFQGEHGEESVRVTQRLSTGEQLGCLAFRLHSGGRSVEASFTGGRWLIMLDGRPVTRKIPENALPSHAIPILAGTLPFESGRAYDVVRLHESEFEPSYGCQLISLGRERCDVVGVDTEVWGFALLEYGVRQMAFWFDPTRRLVRAEHSGLVWTLATPETALADLPEALRGLMESA